MQLRLTKSILGFTLAATAAVLFAPGQVRAGEVAVRFIQAERYTDIGWAPVDRRRNLETLTEHMAAWGKRLPEAQRLEIEVLDVDLAGMERPWGFTPSVRVLNGRIDGPRMTLRWTLRSGSEVLATGEDQISDMGYLMRTTNIRRNEALFHDRRMLDNWLRDRVLEPLAVQSPGGGATKPPAG